MGLKDTYEIGQDMWQFWSKFEGRRVRVWPCDMLLRICAASAPIPAPVEGAEPEWWIALRKKIREIPSQDTEEVRRQDKALDAAVTFCSPGVAHLATVASARLFEANVESVVRQPPGIYFTKLQYWVGTDMKDGEWVAKIDSTDDALFLPFSQIHRIDFIQRHDTRWEKTVAKWVADENTSE